MFKKKKCPECRKKINGKYDFCPYCGNIIEEEDEDWGMLGKKDNINMNNEIKLPFGFNTIFNSLMNSLSKEMNELNKTSVIQNQNQEKKKAGIVKSGISINISSSGNAQPNVSVSYFGDEKTKNQKNKKIKEAESKLFSDEKTEEFLNLSKEEPKTDLRRLSKKIVYEIELAGVVSIEDVSVIKLENSIEIRAIAKDRAYFKIIPINLPLVNYDFSDERLILELAA